MNKLNGEFQNTLIRVIEGKEKQAAIAEMLNVSESTVSRQLSGEVATHLQEICKRLQDECNRLQAERNDLQLERNDLQEQCKVLKLEYNLLKDDRNALQAAYSRLQDVESEKSAAQDKSINLQLNLDKLQAERNDLQARWDAMYGQISPLRGLASSWSILLLSLLVVTFDFHALQTLLEPKLGVLTAVFLSVGVAFSLLVFTASKNRSGRRLAITVTFLVAGLFFDFLHSVAGIFHSVASSSIPANEHIANVLFTVVPPWINAVLTKMLEEGRDDGWTWASAWGKVRKVFLEFFSVK